MDDLQVLPPFTRDLANLLGMDGASELDLPTRRKLVNALESIADYLLGRTEDIGLPESSDSVFNDIGKLATSDRELVRDFIKMLVERRQKKEATA